MFAKNVPVPSPTRGVTYLLVWCVAALIAASPVLAEPSGVVFHTKISSTEGNFTGPLDDFDYFGWDTESLGDLDDDGVVDIAVGATYDDDGGRNRGAVWILFLNWDGTVKESQKISDTEGNFTGILDDWDLFGWSLSSLGDLDLDGVTDLAVGAPFDDDGGTNRGAVWILFLNDNGTVNHHQKISATEGNFTGELDDEDTFGLAYCLGDLDGDDVVDLAVGAPEDDDGGGIDSDRGAVWILFLNDNGTVNHHQKISATEGNFTGELDEQDLFGEWATGLGDLDEDGVVDLAVGALLDDDGGTNRGALWMLFLHENGTVKEHQKISSTQGNFTGPLDDHDWFCVSPTPVGDLNEDGVIDLAVGASEDDDGGVQRGAVWMLCLNTDGTVQSDWKISSTEGNFTGQLDSWDRFANAAALGDFDGDGYPDLAVGASGDGDGGPGRGAVWVLRLSDDVLAAPREPSGGERSQPLQSQNHNTLRPGATGGCEHPDLRHRWASGA
jgi:hypothetical protein